MCKPDIYVCDTELLISPVVDRTTPRVQSTNRISKREKPSGTDGPVTVKVVSPEEMERLWK